MNFTPNISVIMPAYNAGKYIKESIDSVLLQTYKDWELLIINDGSTDNTQLIIDSYVEKDSRIKCFFQKNGKQGKARNLGIENAKGNYIAFLDSDDIMFPHRLRYQLDLILNTESDMVFNDAYKFEKDPLAEKRTTFFVSNHIYLGNEAFYLLLKRNVIPMLTVLVKKSVVEEVGRFTINDFYQNAEDYHLWLKILKYGKKITSDDTIVGAYRIHSNSGTFYDTLSVSEVLFILASFYTDKDEVSLFQEMFNRYIDVFIKEAKKMPRKLLVNKARKILLLHPYSKLHILITIFIDVFILRKLTRIYLSNLFKSSFKYFLGYKSGIK